jgi:hypothetical protein
MPSRGFEATSCQAENSAFEIPRFSSDSPMTV